MFLLLLLLLCPDSACYYHTGSPVSRSVCFQVFYLFYLYRYILPQCMCRCYCYYHYYYARIPRVIIVQVVLCPAQSAPNSFAHSIPNADTVAIVVFMPEFNALLFSV